MKNKFDIFISYARKDFDEVNRFVEMLKERIPSLTCWFDITGIEGGDEFKPKIISAINNSSYVLFAMSKYSMESEWTKDEVGFARAKKKKIIPLLLKNTKLNDNYLFDFVNIDRIDITNSLQVEKLIRNLSDWTGKAVTAASGLKTKTTPSEPNIQVKKEEVRKELHEAVDLGLSVKWATCNVGAASPSDYGDYFAWGETEPKDDYSWETYKWRNTDGNISKYCMNHENEIVDNRCVLKDSDDAASINWSNRWRMPTKGEIEELIEKCTNEKTKIKGIEGIKFTGSNGNSIFLPAAGICRGMDFYGLGLSGHYWSATLRNSDCYAAYRFFFCEGNCSLVYNRRNRGATIRPVCD